MRNNGFEARPSSSVGNSHSRELVVPIRYMGTKRTLAPTVIEAVKDVRSSGRVIDLFSGMGAVASGLPSVSSVVTNDALSFTTVFAQARFLNEPRSSLNETLSALWPRFKRRRQQLRDAYERRLRAETRALEGGKQLFRSYLESAEHAGNSRDWANAARRLKSVRRMERYCLTTLLFSAGYFSTAQAIDLDSLRYSIDMSNLPARSWLLSAWLASASTLANAPGHTAQYLKPNSDAAFTRMSRQWNRDIWTVFAQKLTTISLLGDRHWRTHNEVFNREALSLIKSDDLKNVSIVYADPPYTRDQYSRFYHVLETLYRYDFPEISGEGRYRPDRFTSSFCIKREVHLAFQLLFEAIASKDLILILSYPSDGLLIRSGHSIKELIQPAFKLRTRRTIEHSHSTMGGSKGPNVKTVTEEIYVATPK